MENPSTFEASVLKQIDKSALSTVQVVGRFETFDNLQAAFAGMYEDLIPLTAALRALEANNFIRHVGDQLVPGEDDIYQSYQLTPLGEGILSRSATVTNISNNTNSNIAHNSPNAMQGIDLTLYDKDVQDSVVELKDAVSSGDKEKVKKAIAYILDKAFDLGIQILAAGLGKSINN